jgi:ribosomal protein S27AE
MGKRHIVVDDDTWNELYAIKGPGKSFQRILRELLDIVYPPERELKDQTTLLLKCPACGENSLQIDDNDYFCNNCDYTSEDGVN